MDYLTKATLESAFGKDLAHRLVIELKLIKYEQAVIYNKHAPSTLDPNTTKHHMSEPNTREEFESQWRDPANLDNLGVKQPVKTSAMDEDEQPLPPQERGKPGDIQVELAQLKRYLWAERIGRQSDREQHQTELERHRAKVQEVESSRNEDVQLARAKVATAFAQLLAFQLPLEDEDIRAIMKTFRFTDGFLDGKEAGS